MSTKTLNRLGRWFWREWGRPLLYVAVIVFPLRSSLADWYDVPTGSMRPTILEGDRVFVNKVAYDLKIPFTNAHITEWSDPQRGDVVTFPSPKDGIRLVKRVIGIPGDTLAMRNNHLIVNGHPVSYAMIDVSTMRGLSSQELLGTVLVREELPGKTHPVLFTPQNPAMRNFGPLILPPGNYFMMGDNRDDSADSRYIGPIKREIIQGRVSGVAMSFDRKHYFLPRLKRFFLPM